MNIIDKPTLCVKIDFKVVMDHSHRYNCNSIMSKTNEDSPKVVTINQARAKKIFQRGYENFISGLVEEAIADYEESLQLYPTAEAYTYLGWAMSVKHEYESAIDLCLKAIEISPEYGNPYNDIGAYLIELGREDEAIKWLEKAIQAKDYDCPFYPYFNLGRIYREKSLIGKAISCFEKALSLKPDFFIAERYRDDLSRQLN